MIFGKEHIYLSINMEGVWFLPLINFHEGYFCTGTRAVLYFSLQKSIFLHFINHGTKYDDKYIKSDDRKKYIDDYGSVIKKMVRHLYNEKYLKNYNQRNVLEIDYIKYTRILRVHSGRK